MGGGGLERGWNDTEFGEVGGSSINPNGCGQ